MSASRPEVLNGELTGDALEGAIVALTAARGAAVTSTLGERLEVFEQLSDLLLSGRAGGINGAAFLAAFLRRAHLEEQLAREIPQPAALDGFVPCGARSSVRILPRGMVCHWIAGNVPLLGVFSWAFSALFGNLNLIRASSRNEDVISPIVELVGGLSAAGAEIARRTRVVSFPREDQDSHARMSRVADLRIAWGGEEAVSAVRALPARWECDDLVFGPRRSFAVVDPAAAGDAVLARLANDIVYFDQLACSSPQVVFVTAAAGSTALDAFVGRLAAAIERGTRQHRRHALDWGETYLIELDRQRALLEGGDLYRDTATQWTVVVTAHPLERVSCANRFVQVVPVADAAEIAPWLPANVQTVVMVLDEPAAGAAAEVLARRGVCRFPRPGLGNAFEIPWDGVAVAPRLGHWVTRAQ